MKDVAKHPWLTQRTDGTSNWYLRAKVPVDIVPILRKTEIKKSLRTSARREANQLIDAEAAKVREVFAAARRRLNARPIESLSDSEIKQVALAWFHDAERRRAQRRHAEQLEDDFDPEEVIWTLRQDADIITDTRNPNAIIAIQAEAERLASEQGLSTREKGDRYRKLCEILMRGIREQSLREAAIYRGDHSANFDRMFSKITAEGVAPNATGPNGITLHELIDRFLADPARSQVQKKTKTDYALVFRLTQEVLGRDKLVRTIVREDARKIRDVLATLPPNASKRFKHRTLSEAARYAKRKGIVPLNPVTANGHLNKLSAFFRWAVHEEFLDRNPAVKLSVGAPAASQREARHPFSTEQLNMIFQAPLYAGCQDDERGYAKAGPNRPRRARFWVPLLSLFLGLRLNEACQLRVEDVRREQGVDVILVTPEGEGKKLKSHAARRTIPVHPELIEIGFLNYVAAMRENKEARLFPELKEDGRGYRSDAFQKWFGRFLESVGAKAPKTTFHSFRHNWRDELRAANVPLERAQVMGGWADGSRTDANYGSGFRASDLAEEIAKIDYERLDLRHLYYKP